MIENYIIYNTTSGEITKTLRVETENDTTSLTNNVEAGEDYIAGDEDGSTHYVTGGVATAKILFTAASSWDFTTITTAETATFGTSIPTGTVLRVIPLQNAVLGGATNMTEVEINDGEVEFASPVIGDYLLSFSNEPTYQQYDVTITVEAP